MVVEDPGVSQEDVQQAGTLAELQSVPALVGEERAHIDGKVLLVGERRQQGEAQPVVISFLIEVGGEAVVGAEVFCNNEMLL